MCMAMVVSMGVTMVFDVVGVTGPMGMTMVRGVVVRRERRGGCRDHGNVIT